MQQRVLKTLIAYLLGVLSGLIFAIVIQTIRPQIEPSSKQMVSYCQSGAPVISPDFIKEVRTLMVTDTNWKSNCAPIFMKYFQFQNPENLVFGRFGVEEEEIICGSNIGTINVSFGDVDCSIGIICVDNMAQTPHDSKLFSDTVEFYRGLHGELEKRINGYGDQLLLFSNEDKTVEVMVLCSKEEQGYGVSTSVDIYAHPMFNRSNML